MKRRRTYHGPRVLPIDRRVTRVLLGPGNNNNNNARTVVLRVDNKGNSERISYTRYDSNDVVNGIKIVLNKERNKKYCTRQQCTNSSDFSFHSERPPRYRFTFTAKCALPETHDYNFTVHSVLYTARTRRYKHFATANEKMWRRNVRCSVRISVLFTRAFPRTELVRN